MQIGLQLYSVGARPAPRISMAPSKPPSAGMGLCRPSRPWNLHDRFRGDWKRQCSTRTASSPAAGHVLQPRPARAGARGGRRRRPGALRADPRHRAVGQNGRKTLWPGVDEGRRPDRPGSPSGLGADRGSPWAFPQPRARRSRSRAGGRHPARAAWPAVARPLFLQLGRRAGPTAAVADPVRPAAHLRRPLPDDPHEGRGRAADGPQPGRVRPRASCRCGEVRRGRPASPGPSGSSSSRRTSRTRTPLEARRPLATRGCR